VREWIRDWAPGFEGLIQANAYYDIVGLIGSRWESLGGLLRGTTDGDTGYKDAVAYSAAFLEPLQPRYAPLHDMTMSGGKKTGSDLFTMCRNKPLHGTTPAPIYFADGSGGVICWWIGTNVPLANHLLVDAEGALHISCQLLRDELLHSMATFADYLESGPAEVREAFRRAHWMTLRPQGYERKAWLSDGRQHLLFK